MPSNAAPVVLDTDLASFLIKEDPIRAPRYLPRLNYRIPILPFSAVAELLCGAEDRNWGEIRCRRMNEFFNRCRVIGADRAVCAAWAHIPVVGRKAGRLIERQDAWVAAVALYLEAPLLTHNARHYAAVPQLRVISEPDAR